MGYKDPDRQREYQRAWTNRKRRVNRAAYFAGKSCAWCGSVDQLELDHINPADKISHLIWTWSPLRRAAELAKCQALCKPCHDRKCGLDGFIDRTPRHGIGRYDKGCRCDTCKAANTEHARRVRQNRRMRERSAS
jgi:hypothetical protein